MADDSRSVVLRPACPDDAGAIAELQALSPEAAQWRSEDYLDYSTTVAESGSRVAGFIVVREVASDEFEVLNIAVHPEFRGRGIGSALFEEAASGREGQWFLEVRASNGRAIFFYEKHGFNRAGIRPNYYRVPAEDAVVMRKGS